MGWNCDSDEKNCQYNSKIPTQRHGLLFNTPNYRFWNPDKEYAYPRYECLISIDIPRWNERDRFTFLFHECLTAETRRGWKRVEGGSSQEPRGPHLYPLAHLVCPPKLCISFVLNTQKKLKIMVIQKFGAKKGGIFGILVFLTKTKYRHV